MNVHIYKGQVHKSTIFEQMISSWEHALGIVYYTQDRPYPNHVGGVYMMPSDLMNEDEFVYETIPYLMEKTDAHMIIIYTNKTEEEMMKVRNLGRKSLEEVHAKLKELGLNLRNGEVE